MENDPFANKRLAVRVNIALDAQLVVIDTNAAGLVEGGERIKLRLGKIQDLSLGGARVITADLRPDWHSYLLSGAIGVVLRFTLPTGAVISTPAAVSWIKDTADQKGRKFIVGLRFTGLSPEDSRSLIQFIAPQKHT